MRRIGRMLALALCAAMLLAEWIALPAGAAESAEKPAPVVRVLLRRLNLTDRIDLTLEGAYQAETKNGTRLLLPAGSGVTVQIRQDRLILFLGEISVDAGASLSLTRQASSGEDGSFRVLPWEGRYAGNLMLTVAGGQLQPVVSMSVEDYLPGVVPYEMSDSFPLEALKAQAICARTYALSRVDSSKAWDLVDTTNDQVFRGVTDAHPNAERAVKETAGLVVTDAGGLVNCYYSASNGGQTEIPAHVWSGAERSRCYEIMDDPYDVENPESILKTVRLNRDGTGLPEAFLALIREAAQGLPQLSEFARGEEAFRVDEIQGVELAEPRFASPSRLMTKLKMTLRVSARQYELPETPDPLTYEADGEASATPAPMPGTEAGTAGGTDGEAAGAMPEKTEIPATPEPVLGPYRDAGTLTVTIPIFPNALRALGLSIYGADNEIITVTEEKDAFRLAAGRYGHGVGMSQRGAQWMAAHYGKNFLDILEFYYPGAVIKIVSTGKAAVPTPDPALAEMPGPAATPTPRPTLMPVTAENLPEGAWLASVEHIEDDSTLNLRAEPAASGEILMRLYRHQRLIVLEECEDPAWVHVRTDAAEGYVMISFLEKVQ